MMNEYKQTIEKVNNMQTTENGALGYSTSGKKLVDLNFSVPSNHSNVTPGAYDAFKVSLKENLVDTVKWMFYLRDVREGLGERDSFITFFCTLYNENPEVALKVLPLVPIYGRWKDVIDILSKTADDTTLAEAIYDMVKKQFLEDTHNCLTGQPVSLLAKWLPSVNASKKARVMATRICRNLGLIMADYRKMLSGLRKYIDVTEVKTCAGEWEKVDYNKVSSNANSRYVNAFMRHDPERRQKYLKELEKPVPVGAVMHASNLYPHEVYAKYNLNGHTRCPRWDPSAEPDAGVEALWRNLKDMETISNTMVVCDGSGSMQTPISGAKGIQAIDVSRALGIYFSERAAGEFKDKVIEFSANPTYIDLSGCKTLADKYNVMTSHDECSNTNIEKVFDLLLKTAVDNSVKQEELPESVLIVSDMEFDMACEMTVGYQNSNDIVMSYYQTLFETIQKRWEAAGYVMPRLVFWNVNSRTNTIPVTSNKAGVILVSGFSVNTVKMVMSGSTDPWEALKGVLDSERYDAVQDAIMS